MRHRAVRHGERRTGCAALARAHGFSLLELVISLGIGVVVLGLIFHVVSASGRSVGATANVFQAIHLSSKILSDITEEARIRGSFGDPYRRFTEMRTRDPVLDGSSIWFRYIKDRGAPFGSIDLGTEGGIRRDDGKLYEQLQGFTAEVKLEPGAAPSSDSWRRHVLGGTINIAWNEKDGRPVTYRLPIQLPAPIGPPCLEGLDIDEAVMTRQINDFLFPDHGPKTLAEMIFDARADPAMVDAVGRIGVMSSAVQAGLASLTAEMNRARQEAVAAGNRIPDLLKAQRTCARYADAGASLIYQVLVSIGPALTRIDQAGTSQSLAGIPEGRFRMGLNTVKSFRNDLAPWLAQARRHYSWMLNPTLTGVISERDREWAINKLLDCHRLEFALGLVPATGWRDFVYREQQRVVGRNQYWERVFLHEADVMNDRVALLARFPHLAQITAYLEQTIDPLIAKIPDFINRHPGG